MLPICKLYTKLKSFKYKKIEMQTWMKKINTKCKCYVVMEMTLDSISKGLEESIN
jgi:hypothetical protein